MHQKIIWINVAHLIVKFYVILLPCQFSKWQTFYYKGMDSKIRPAVELTGHKKHNFLTEYVFVTDPCNIKIYASTWICMECYLKFLWRVIKGGVIFGKS
jgi:hypothetical protein